MVTIKLSVYEKADLLRYLQYAKEQKLINQPTPKKNKMFDDTGYDIHRINVLMERVKGNFKEDYQQTSRRYSKDHGNLKERPKDDLPKAPFIRTE
jgi:hypothetical protein